MKNFKLLLCSFCLFLFSCGEIDKSFDFKQQGGVQYTLRLPLNSFMNKLTNGCNQPGFVKALKDVDPALTPEKYFSSLFEYANNKETHFNLKSILAVENKELFDNEKLQNQNEEYINALLQEYNIAIDKSINIVEARLNKFQVSSMNIYKKGHVLIVEVPGMSDNIRIRRVMTANADVGFYTPYRPTDVATWLFSAENERTRNDDTLVAPEKIEENESLFDYLIVKNENVYGDQFARVAHVRLQDTAMVNQLIGNVNSSHFPLDYMFLWSVNQDRNMKGYFELFCVQTPPRLTGENIVEAHLDYDYSNMPCVTMQFNNEGAEEWEAYTEERTGKPIVMVIDNHVYSAPQVMEKITGGMTQISGNMELEFTEDLANILNVSSLPYPLYIVNEKVVNPTP